MPDRNRTAWLRNSPWIVLVIGVVLALAMVVVSMTLLMAPPFREMASLVGMLAATSILSLAVGYFLYRRGWAHSPSLALTLIFTYAWAALLTLVNVWVLARLMFVDPHDLALAGILLIFAAIIATTFGIFVAASVTDGLRQLARTAMRVAGGDLSARSEVVGRNEVSRVALAFNEMAEQLQQAAAKREEIDTLRRDLIAWTSHDLRTPLTSIRVMIEALNDGMVEDEETRDRYYRTLKAEVLALNNLIDDLFELAQLEAGGIVFDADPQSLSDLISDTLESFRPVADNHRVSLEGKVSQNLDPVTMNASRIGRVLSNLVSNAIQHTPEGGCVRLAAERTVEGAQVTVQDSGPGFSADDLPRVFEKFYRGEEARSRSTGGAGLGLAIACGIVEAHGGRIWAQNVEKSGAQIGFVLPD